MTPLQVFILLVASFISFWLGYVFGKFRTKSVSLDIQTFNCSNLLVTGVSTGSSYPDEIAAAVYPASNPPGTALDINAVRGRWTAVAPSPPNFTITATRLNGLGDPISEPVIVAVWPMIDGPRATAPFNCSPGWGTAAAESSMSVPPPAVSAFQPPSLPQFTEPSRPRKEDGQGGSGTRGAGGRA
jgi:hypothetical protein